MSLTKRERTTIFEFEQQVKEIRSQLSDQLRCLEQRTETQVSLLNEVHEYFRRRAEIDAEHARQLDKLAKSIMQKHKNEKNRRESWSLHGTCTVWRQLVDETKEEARQGWMIADLYSNHLLLKLTHRAEDIQRVSKKCREIGAICHGEIGRVLTELHTAMKTYQICYSQFASVEGKLRIAEQDKQRYEEANPKKIGATRKHRALGKHLDKRMCKFEEMQLKTRKARNEYLLCVNAANAALSKYFADDLSDLIDCMDIGLEHWLSQLIACVVQARKTLAQRNMDAIAELSGLRDLLDAKADKQHFFEANHSLFMLPKRFEFRPQTGDEEMDVSAAGNIAGELAQRSRQIERRLADLRLDADEVWKSMESAEARMLALQTDPLAITPQQLGQGEMPTFKETDGVVQKRKMDLIDVEDFYLTKFSHYLLTANLIERLRARFTAISNAVARHSMSEDLPHPSNGSAMIAPARRSSDGEGCETPGSSVGSADGNVKQRMKKKRIGLAAGTRRPRLFGGSLEEYVEATGEQIPVLIISCIRVLSQFALHHQGVFRVSGSQIEIAAFKEAFERGEDPLGVDVDASDVNSVAGVLKLYLRELREPLFPMFLFDQLTECAKCPNSEEFIRQVVPLLRTLSDSSCRVLRYLFAFLNHLSEFSDENMMDPYNLAICFGPTLLPIPEGKDQVFYHNFVNELVKNLIIYHDEIFKWNLDGPIYHKYSIFDDYGDECDGGVNVEEDPPSIAAPRMFASVVDRLPAMDAVSLSSTPPSPMDQPISPTLPSQSPFPGWHPQKQPVSTSDGNRVEIGRSWQRVLPPPPDSTDSLQLTRRRMPPGAISATGNSPPPAVWTRRGLRTAPVRSPDTVWPPYSCDDTSMYPSTAVPPPRHRLSLQTETSNTDPSGQMPSALSPSTLLEIQSELRAVLSSLSQLPSTEPDLVRSLPPNSQHDPSWQQLCLSSSCSSSPPSSHRL